MAQQIDIIANFIARTNNVETGINRLKNSLNQLKLPTNLENSFKKSFGNLDTILAKYKSQLEKGFNTKTDVSNFTKLGKDLDSELNRIQSNLTKLTGKSIDFKVNTTELVNAEKKLNEVVAAREKLTSSVLKLNIDGGSKGSKDIETLLTQFGNIAQSSTKAGQSANSALASLQMGNIKEAVQYLRELQATYNNLGKGKKNLFEEQTGMTMKTAIADIVREVTQMESKFTEADGAIKTAADDVARIHGDQVQKAGDAASKAATGFENTASAARKANGEAQNFANSMYSAKSQVEQLQQSTQYFFSLRNMVNLLRRGIRDVVDTVKDLDKAMTETAVVTKFSVGDMWAKLPEYTANANALGATVQSMYEATTLYYQQGLNAQQAMEIANETMKMARIGGLEAATATDMMTAALRGFNMELNETSAQRINDVYSNLAAKTASNTKELGTAMQRTASIAASAGMSFEGTAAFLAQAIETTREPAENLGTAMKTIVARFQELKKNPLEMQEVDGEEVNYNKVDEALQSIGVSLKDANGQFRDLDQVFLDIAQRWDSLTQVQQRYVATTAAGSRQQSRFIAMMSNYERTLQLMDYANNSEGASAAQFDKTLESLEAKINKFQNAWKQFLMGIMDNSWIKGIVDGGTKVLGIINNLINTLSGGGKHKGIKSFLSLFTAFMGLKIAGRGINRLIGGLGGLVDPTLGFRRGFWGAGGQTAGMAGKISTPIVQKLSELIAVTRAANGLKNTNNPTITSTAAQYQAISSRLRNSMPTTMGSIGAQFKQLSDTHAYMAYRTNPGTVSAIQRSALGWLNNQPVADDAKQVGQQLMNNIFRGMQKGEISVKKGMELLGKPQKWGTYFGTDVAQNFSQTYLQATQQIRKQNAIKAHENTLYSLGLDPKQYQFQSDEFKKFMSDDPLGIKKQYATLFKDWNDTLNIGQTEVKPQKFEQVGNNIAALGSKFTSAGYSIQMFGSQLAQLSPALQGVGTLISKLGGLVLTFGYGFSGVGKIVTSVGAQITAGLQAARLVRYGEAMGAAINSGAVAASAVAPIAGTAMASGKAFVTNFLNNIPTPLLVAGMVAAVIGAITLISRKIEKDAQEAGKEVRENFEKGFTENEKKLESITNSKDRFEELSRGIDKYGHNISLTNEEYDEYVSLSRELAETSPSLIAGYNAEGEAILKKGAALQEVIDKLKEERKEALNSFITDSSINKLIGEYKTSDTYKQYKQRQTREGDVIHTFHNELNALAHANNKGKLDFDVADAIEQLGGGTVASLSSLSTEQMMFVSQHYSDILNLIKEKNGELDENVEEGLKNALGDISGAFEDVQTEGQPIIEALQRWMGDENLDAIGIGLAEEFESSFSNGFNAIMTKGLSEGWSSETFKTELKTFSNEWKHLGVATSEYSDILEEATKCQDAYLDTVGTEGAVQKYQNDVEGLALKLEQLAAQYEDTGSAGQAFAEQCIQQANALRNYTTVGAISLSEALNTATDEIAVAEAALDDFNTATKTDYWTAAEGMKGIYDKITETYKDSFGGEYQKHAEGYGDETFWTGAKALLGEETVSKLTANKEGEEIAKALSKGLKDIEPMLREGEEGFYNFRQRVLENADALDKLAENGVEYNKETGLLTNIPEDQWHNVALALGISDELLTSMLNKGRQFSDINFTNLSEVRAALETSDSAIKGISSKKGKKALYVKEESFKAELEQAGFHTDQQKQQQIDKVAKEQNVQMLKAAAAYAGKAGKEELKGIVSDMGIENLPDLIQTLSETGEFSRDEIKAYADKLGYTESDEKFISIYDDIISALENDELAKQTSIQQDINNKLNMLVDKRDLDEHKSVNAEWKEMVYGKEGVMDTAFQKFSLGQDEHGNTLSAGEYAQTKKNMEEASQKAHDTAEYYRNMAEYAESKEDREAYEKLAKSYENGANWIDKWIEAGTKAYEENEAKREKEKEDREKEKEGRKKGKEIEDKANKEKKDKETKDATDAAQEKGKKRTKDEKNKSITPEEERKARDEGKKQDAQSAKQKEIEEANKKRWENETKHAEKISELEKKNIEDKQKKQKDLQQKSEVEGQKLRQRYEKEEQAQKRKNIEEQTKLEGQKLTERAKHEQEALYKAQQESKDIGRTQTQQLSTEQLVQQSQSIEHDAQFLLKKNINDSLKNAITNLDSTEIASDPEQTQAFANIYKDLINNRLPNAQDLDKLGILNQLDSNYQEQLPNIDKVTSGIKEKVSNLQENLKAGYDAFAKADKTALAMDVVPKNWGENAQNRIKKGLQGLSEIIENWVNRRVDTLPKQGEATISHDQKSGQTRTEQLKTIFNSENADKVKKEEDDIKAKADKGAEHITTFKTEGTPKVEGQLQKLTDSGSETRTIKINTDTSGAEKPIQKDIIPNSKLIDTKMNTIDAWGRRKISKNIDYHVTKSGISTINITVKKNNQTVGTTSESTHNGYTGLSNKISYHHVPMAGSLAGGTKKGRVGPRNQGGLTLTGELGYEVAWLPSQHKSTILGANGPQMVNLPKDAVVYNHEQSKEIMKKRKGIPAGSLETTNASDSLNSRYDDHGGSNTSGGNKGKNKNKNRGNSNKDKTEKDNQNKAKKVIVWWENIARKTEAVQRKADKAYSQFEKYIKSLQATLRETGTKGQGNQYIANMNKVISYNQKQYDKASKGLKDLDTSNKKTTIKYGKDKKKKTKLSKFIKYDEKTGAYVIDQKALNKASKKYGKDYAQAVKDEAEKEINDKQSKKNKAEDEIQKAKEALEKFGEELYETFFSWKNELTEILDITSKIEEAQKRISNIDAYATLLNSILDTGQSLVETQSDAKRSSFLVMRSKLDPGVPPKTKTTDRGPKISLNDGPNLSRIGLNDANHFNRGPEINLNDGNHWDNNKNPNKELTDILKKTDNDMTQGFNTVDKSIREAMLKNFENRLKNLKDILEEQAEAITESQRILLTDLSSYDERQALESVNAILESNELNGVELNETQRAGYEAWAKKLKEQIETIESAQQFMTVEYSSDGTVSVDVDQDALEQAKLEGRITGDAYNKIKEYIEQIREDSSTLKENYTAIAEHLNEYYSILGELQQQWTEYGEELLSISTEAEEKKIDNLKKLSDSVKNALDKLLKDVKAKLDERRKQEDNAKTERDISQKQQRLAALRADTAGGHQVEIAQLEKEIADAQQDYQRTLEDQLIDRMQEQADEAAEQREKQIALQEALLSTTDNIAKVNMWMANPKAFKEEIREAYYQAKGYDTAIDSTKADIERNFESFFTGLETNQTKQVEVLEEIRDELPKYQQIADEAANSTPIEAPPSNTYSLSEAKKHDLNAQQAYDKFKATASWADIAVEGGYTAQDFADAKVDFKNAFSVFSAKDLKSSSYYKSTDAKQAYEDYKKKISENGKLSDKELLNLQKYANVAGYGPAYFLEDLAKTKELTWKQVINHAVSSKIASASSLAKTFNSKPFKEAFEKIYNKGAWEKYKNNKKGTVLSKAYATGGLADFTGPAWLDGTPSRPELVLNARDTQNFIALKDVLSKAMGSIGATAETYGDILYEININVDKIEKDYDVDRVVDKVKKEIVKSSGYRNVTQVRNLR